MHELLTLRVPHTPLADALRAARLASEVAAIVWYDDNTDDSFDAMDSESGRAMLAADALADAALLALVQSDEPRAWNLTFVNWAWDDETFSSTSIEQAVARAIDAVFAYDIQITETRWIDIKLECLLTRQIEQRTLTLHPEPPDCLPDTEHHWCAPHRIVGGDPIDPGVVQHATGLHFHEVCRHCAKHRHRTTGVVRPDTGVAGLESIRYEYEDAETMAWAGWRPKVRARTTLR